jgi:nickel/cobalt exporter
MRLKRYCLHLYRRLPVVLLATSLAVGLALGTPVGAFAHPLGNFTINRYSKLTAVGQELQILYIVDMAEIPTHAERTQIDADADGSLSDAELDRYRNTVATQMLRGVALTVDGVSAPLEPDLVTLNFPSGQAGLPTLRLEVTAHAALQGALQGAADHVVRYTDHNYADRLGWQEVIVVAQRGGAITHSSAPVQDRSHGLTNYPQDLLLNPPQVSEASFAWRPAVARQAAGEAISAGAMAPALVSANAGLTSNGRPSDPFAELIAIPELGLGAVLLALLASLGWGAMHAMSPGHGKTLVAAYLVGAQGTAKHALFLGLTTTITHTAGVFALGFVTLALSRYILPEQLYPWMSAASGILVVLIGLSLARNRLLRGAEHHYDHDHEQDHDHGHDQGHDHTHGPDHTHGDDHAHVHAHGNAHEHHHDHAHGHSHLPPGADGRPVTWPGLLALGISGGLLPCPSALVLMLGAISLNRIGFGLLLIVAFSLGLAGVLTLFGIALVHAGKWFERIPEGGRIVRFVPVASALFITAVGLVITLQALALVRPLPGLLPS